MEGFNRVDQLAEKYGHTLIFHLESNNRFNITEIYILYYIYQNINISILKHYSILQKNINENGQAFLLYIT